MEQDLGCSGTQPCTWIWDDPVINREGLVKYKPEMTPRCMYPGSLLQCHEENGQRGGL